MRKLISHIPPFLEDIREYNEIFNAEEEEMKKIENEIEKIIQEVSVETAVDYGLDRFEKILNIPNVTNDIYERRFNIKSKMISQLPFNMNWLENKLKSLVGTGNYTISLNPNNFQLSIYISHIFPDIVNNLNTTLRQEIPANLVLIINLFKSDDINTYIGSFIHRGAKRYFAYNN